MDITSIPPPAPFLQWLGLLGVTGGLIGFFISRWDRKSDISNAKLNDFWFQTIVVPICVTPLIEFADKTVSDLEAIHLQLKSGTLDNGLVQEKLSRFTKEKIGILDRSRLLTIFGTELDNSFKAGLDKVEDEIQEHIVLLCATPDSAPTGQQVTATLQYMRAFVWAKTKDMINEIIEHHKCI